MYFRKLVDRAEYALCQGCVVNKDVIRVVEFRRWIPFLDGIHNSKLGFLFTCF
ncbi:hypothetical protein HanXRQr2_Chr17g0828071 [Helianthus annuus]|uniref:Uncharacterized protein n=1 Tax=Helianthus annuus TaxID=4232 RepID=A0A9K3DM48_HELAN|nr:hypothetical protein HanXRQr2_Chr17g0828071 [Helianthus annuus]